MIAAILAWFNPGRLILAGSILLALIAAQIGFGAYWHHKGYVKRDDQQKVAEAKQAAKIADLQQKLTEKSAEADANNAALQNANIKTTDSERARVAALLDASRLRRAARPGVPSTDNAANCVDESAALAGVAVTNAGIAQQNADQVTGLQAWIEGSRREQVKALGVKDTRKPTDAEARLAARLKSIDERQGSMK